MASKHLKSCFFSNGLLIFTGLFCYWVFRDLLIFWNMFFSPDRCFANISSQSSGLSFHFLTVACEEQMFLISIELINVLHGLCFWFYKKFLPNSRSQRFSLVFFSEFYSFGLYIWSVFNFHVILHVRQSLDWSSLSLYMDVQFFQRCLLKRLFFLDWIAFILLLTFNKTVMFLNSLILFHWSLCLCLHQYHTDLITACLEI